MCAHKKRQHQDSTWEKFRQVMSRFTANVEAVVAAFLLSSSSTESSAQDLSHHLAMPSSPQRVQRRVLIPTGRAAMRLLQERRQACSFHSIADDVDSDEETEGSESDALGTGWDDSTEWHEQWSVLVAQSRYLDGYVKHMAAHTIQRAMRNFLWSRQQHTIATHLIRVRTPLKCLFRLQQEIDAKHHAASVLQHAWRRRRCRRQSSSPPQVVNRLKRKRPSGDCNLKPSDVYRQSALLAQAFHSQDTKDMLVQALLC